MEKSDYLTPDGIYTENDRILLRTLSEQDRDIYLKICIDVSNIKEMYDDKFKDLTWTNILKDNDLVLLIVDKASGEVVGRTFLMHLAAEMQELGIDILTEYRRQHYGYDAIKLLTDHARAVSGKNEFAVKVYDDNAPSHALFQKFNVEVTGSEPSELIQTIGYEKFLELKEKNEKYKDVPERHITVYKLTI